MRPPPGLLNARAAALDERVSSPVPLPAPGVSRRACAREDEDVPRAEVQHGPSPPDGLPVLAVSTVSFSPRGPSAPVSLLLLSRAAAAEPPSCRGASERRRLSSPAP